MANLTREKTHQKMFVVDQDLAIYSSIALLTVLVLVYLWAWFCSSGGGPELVEEVELQPKSEENQAETAV